VRVNTRVLARIEVKCQEWAYEPRLLRIPGAVSQELVEPGENAGPLDPVQFGDNVLELLVHRIERQQPVRGRLGVLPVPRLLVRGDQPLEQPYLDLPRVR